MGDDRIARVVDPRTGVEQLERLAAFYRTLDRDRCTLELPLTLERGEVDGRLYTIEVRIPGSDMMQVFGGLEGAARIEAIRGYMEAGLALRAIVSPTPSFHRPLDPERAEFETFSALLISRAERAASRAGDELRAEISSYDMVFDAWVSQMDVVDPVTPTLVHGDLFPGNVMALEGGTVTGIVDFSNLTMWGDWRLDAVSSLAFLEQVPGWTPADSEIARSVIEPHVGSNFEEIERLYKLFYALYFAPFARLHDPELYEWSRGVITAY